MSNQSPFKWRHFEAEIIVLCVRWYLRYSLSYRDLEEMMRERGLSLDHSTIYRSRAALCPRTGEALSAASQSHQ
jgi:transposase-like protein